MTPRSGHNKTARAAVLHGSMFSKPCAPAQGRVPCTRAAAQAAGLRLLYHIFKLTLRALLAFTKKHGIYAARLMLRLRLAFTNRTYYTMTPRSGLNKTAPAAVLHGSMFSKPCASAQGRVPCTRAAAQAAGLRLLYHISLRFVKSRKTKLTQVSLLVPVQIDKIRRTKAGLKFWQGRV